MSLIDRIPTLTDEEVVNLLANARRLSNQGDARRKAAADEILPALEIEADTRHQAHLEQAKAKRAAKRPSKVAVDA